MARILIVEDDITLADALRYLLERRGCAVSVVHDGRQAVELSDQARFDLVITDLIMPEQEGIETILKLRRQQPTLPIIAISGGGMGDAQDYLRMAKNVGAAAALAKPFALTELLECIRKLVTLPEDAPEVK